MMARTALVAAAFAMLLVPPDARVHGAALRTGGGDHPAKHDQLAALMASMCVRACVRVCVRACCPDASRPLCASRSASYFVHLLDLARAAASNACLPLADQALAASPSV